MIGMALRSYRSICSGRDEPETMAKGGLEKQAVGCNKQSDLKRKGDCWPSWHSGRGRALIVVGWLQSELEKRW